MALQDVSQALWTERELLERLLSKLEEERALMAAGDQQWVTWCIDEIGAIVERLEEAEVRRREAWASVADELGVAPDAPLSELMQRAQHPWDTILCEHQRALGGACRELMSSPLDEALLDGSGASGVADSLRWARPAPAA